MTSYVSRSICSTERMSAVLQRLSSSPRCLQVGFHHRGNQRPVDSTFEVLISFEALEYISANEQRLAHDPKYGGRDKGTFDMRVRGRRLIWTLVEHRSHN